MTQFIPTGPVLYSTVNTYYLDLLDGYLIVL